MHLPDNQRQVHTVTDLTQHCQPPAPWLVRHAATRLRRDRIMGDQHTHQFVPSTQTGDLDLYLGAPACGCCVDDADV
jgi:hypothetical protein